MELGKDFYNSQLDAIQNFYNNLLQKDKNRVSLTEAIITWFTEGHAERFRKQYLEQHALILN